MNLVFVFVACLLMSQVFLGVCFSDDKFGKCNPHES